MKDKFKNLKNKKLLIFAVIICAIAVLVFSTKEQLFKTNSLQTEDNKETISIKGAVFNAQIVPLIKPTTNGDFFIDGKNIVTQASSYLGTDYSTGSFDCSKLVQNALSKAGVTGISGLHLSDSTSIPRQTMDWFSNTKGNAWSQLKYWKYKNGKITEIYYNGSQNMGPSIRDNSSALKVTTNNVTKQMNVLKINDPITSNLRWYQYYDEKGKKQELPMGTIIMSYGSQWTSSNGWKNGKQNHAWIAIGNLGTSNANEAANILVKMGIIKENQKQYVESNGSCNYWRIENAGSTGVRINNGDPDMSLDGEGKKIGPIWAFQVANDNIGTISFGVNKVSSRNSNKKVNATFKYKLTTQDGNSSIKNGQIVANSGNKVTISY